MPPIFKAMTKRSFLLWVHFKGWSFCQWGEKVDQKSGAQIEKRENTEDHPPKSSNFHQWPQRKQATLWLIYVTISKFCISSNYKWGKEKKHLESVTDGDRALLLLSHWDSANNDADPPPLGSCTRLSFAVYFEKEETGKREKKPRKAAFRRILL